MARIVKHTRTVTTDLAPPWRYRLQGAALALGGLALLLGGWWIAALLNW